MAKTSLSLITYEIAHRKTQEVLFRTLRRGTFSVSLTIVPFKPRPERKTRIQHRPNQFVGPSARSLAAAFDLPCRPVEDWRSFHRSIDHFLICTGALIEPDFCAAANIIKPMIERPDTSVPFLRTQTSASNSAAVLTKRAAARACSPRWLQIVAIRDTICGSGLPGGVAGVGRSLICGRRSTAGKQH